MPQKEGVVDQHTTDNASDAEDYKGVTAEMAEDTIQDFWEDVDHDWQSSIQDWVENFQMEEQDVKEAHSERQKLLATFKKNNNRAQFWNSQVNLLSEIFNKLAKKDV